MRRSFTNIIKLSLMIIILFVHKCLFEKLGVFVPLVHSVSLFLLG